MTGQPTRRAKRATPLDALAWHHPQLPNQVTIHLATTDRLAALGWIRPDAGDQTGAVALLTRAVAHRFGAHHTDVILHPARGHADPRLAQPASAQVAPTGPAHSSQLPTLLWTSRSRCGPFVVVTTALVPVGIDIEVLQTPVQATELLTMLHVSDQYTLGQFTGTDRAHEVTAAWTRKEALLKGFGTGLQRDPGLDAVGTRTQPVHAPGWTTLSVRVEHQLLPHRSRQQDYYIGVAWHQSERLR